jgi:hypothetical protein
MHPEPGQPGEQGLQHVGGCPGVVQGPVPGLGSGAEEAGQRRQLAVGHLGIAQH